MIRSLPIRRIRLKAPPHTKRVSLSSLLMIIFAIIPMRETGGKHGRTRENRFGPSTDQLNEQSLCTQVRPCVLYDTLCETDKILVSECPERKPLASSQFHSPPLCTSPHCHPSLTI
mmetsp:Transcript_1620/g.5598  ORF Transcript_1620/g.5598 Transcript_1620/m.5598 type:complete len:116 (-) Transcript_1620:2629-2976(-)